MACKSPFGPRTRLSRMAHHTIRTSQQKVGRCTWYSALFPPPSSGLRWTRRRRRTAGADSRLTANPFVYLRDDWDVNWMVLTVPTRAPLSSSSTSPRRFWRSVFAIVNKGRPFGLLQVSLQVRAPYDWRIEAGLSTMRCSLTCGHHIARSRGLTSCNQFKVHEWY